MTMKKAKCRLIAVGVCLWGAALLFPSLSRAQQLASQALSTFPADTRQLAVADLTQLRSSPDYAQIRQRLLNAQLRNFEDFVRSMGIDPDKDVDSVVMGWRGEASDSSRFFGLAEGRFQPEQIHQSFSQSKLPIRQYGGLELFAYGSGEDSADLFFAFLTSSLGAFGRQEDLKALIDVWSGNASALNSNSNMVSWEAELEGTAPQWGIVGGQAAANLVGPWLGGSKKLDASSFFAPVQAVLYRVNWDSGFSARLSVVCKDSQSAAGLVQLFSILRSAQVQPSGSPGSGPLAFIQGMDISQSGSRVELSGTGSLDALDQVLHGKLPEKAQANPPE